jgi:putative DNA primase/helicase
MTTLRTAAAKYASLGYAIIPVHWIREDGSCSCGDWSCTKPGKHPINQHGASDPITDPVEATLQWDELPKANIGIVAGPTGWVIIDIDSEAARDHFRSIADYDTIEAMKHAPINKTGKGWHFIFRDDEREFSPSVGKDENTGIDIRAGVSFIVAPPSQHVTGHHYAWMNAAPPFDPPQPTRWLRNYILTRNSDRTKTIIDEAATVTEGSRNATMAELAGSMRRRGFSEDEILAALLKANQRVNKPPLDDREISSIAHSIANYPPSDVPKSLGEPAIDMKSIDEVIEQTSGDEPPSLATGLELLNIEQMMITDPPEIEWVWKDYLAKGTLNLLHGDAGLGKSLISLAIATACTIGGTVLNRETRRSAVAIIDAENSGDEIHRRIRKTYNRISNTKLMHYYRADEAILGLRDSTVALFAHIHKTTGAELFILDSQRALWEGDEKEQAEAGRMLRHLARVAEALGICILIIHHDTKAGQYSGSSDISAALTGSRLHLTRASKNNDADSDEWSQRKLVHAKCRMGAEQAVEQFKIELGNGIELVHAGPSSLIDHTARLIVAWAQRHTTWPMIPTKEIHEEFVNMQDRRKRANIYAHMHALGMIESPPKHGERHVIFADQEHLDAT